MRGHGAPSLELQRMTDLAHIYLLLLSHLQTQGAIWRMGQLRLPGRKAGLVGTVQSGTLDFSLGNLAYISSALTVRQHLK